MHISRRRLLQAGLGLGQFALLDRFGLLERSARAAPGDGGPTKFLSLMVTGGLHFEHFVSPFADAGAQNYLPGTEAYPFYQPSWLGNFDQSDGPGDLSEGRPIRGPVWWSWSEPYRNGANSRQPGDPKHVTGRSFDPKGYAWAAPEYRIFEDAVFIHGIDQQTAAHESGIVASICGLAGATFAAPAVQAVIANYFARRFPDRVLPSAVIGRMSVPAVGLPAIAGPKRVDSLSDIEWTLSDRPRNWNGLRDRQDSPEPGFRGDGSGAAPLTAVDRFVLESTRNLAGRSSAGTDDQLEQLYGSYVGISKALAKDVVSLVESTPGFEHLTSQHPSWMPNETLLGWRIGYADAVASGNTWRSNFDLALRFLKSDIASSVSVRTSGLGQFNFDTHYANPYRPHSEHLHGVMESIGQLLCEMKQTPGSEAGKSLLDETLVYIHSDFGRTFRGSDHNPMTTAILVGGGIRGNQMYGGFDQGPNGIPVTVREEDGRVVQRPLKSQDTIATILTAFGMHMGEDFFLPGGYAEVVGVRRS